MTEQSVLKMPGIEMPIGLLWQPGFWIFLLFILLGLAIWRGVWIFRKK